MKLKMANNNKKRYNIMGTGFLLREHFKTSCFSSLSLSGAVFVTHGELFPDRSLESGQGAG